jgi:hypothetical protein
MCFSPPPESQPGASPETGADLEKSYSFSHLPPTFAKCEFTAALNECQIHRYRPYSELTLVLPSKTPASEQFKELCRQRRFCACEVFAPQPFFQPGEPMKTVILSLIQPVERM